MFLPALHTKYDAEHVTTSFDSGSQKFGPSHERCRSQTSRPPSAASWAVIGALPSHSVMRVIVTSPRVIDSTDSPLSVLDVRRSQGFMRPWQRQPARRRAQSGAVQAVSGEQLFRRGEESFSRRRLSLVFRRHPARLSDSSV